RLGASRGRRHPDSGGWPADPASTARVATVRHRHFPAPQDERQLAPHDAWIARRHEPDRRGPVERLAGGHGEQHAGGEPLVGEIAQARRILRPHLPQLELRAAARRPWAVSWTPRYGTCSISPASESRFTIPLTEGGATSSIAAMSLVAAKPPRFERW